VVLDELPTREFAKIREAQAAWKAQGVETDLLELGAVFSFEGTLFDSRLTLICTRAVHATVDQARRQREEISGWSGKELRRQEVLLQRPSGMISLRSQDGSTVVSARNAMWFEPIKEEGLTVPDVEFGKGFRWHGRETRRYSGSFYVAVDRHAHLALVNVLPAERLLQGVVPAEIYATAHPEALKAQAIAARNELFSKIGHRHLADPFLLCANQHCQVYKGLDAERATTSKAVLDTRGKVLFNQHGKLADCRYHSTDGGHTENSEEAWPGVNAPELRGRFTTKSPGQDPYRPLQQEEVLQFIDQPPVSWESGSSRTRNTWRWTESFSAEKVNQQVQQTHGIRRLERIEVLRRGVSGRVNHIRLHGEGRSVEVQGELVIRKLFFGLKSSLFVVEPRLDPKGTPVEWVFRGGGFGHGVGMSQNGAVEMAAGGKTFVEILQYYYHKVTLGRIY
jgi:SpoIID/LytB domain protein